MKRRVTAPDAPDSINPDALALAQAYGRTGEVPTPNGFERRHLSENVCTDPQEDACE